MLGCSIKLVHTQVLGQRCGVLMDLLPILYPQVCRWVHCVPWPYLWVLQDVVGRRVSCKAWRKGKWLWAESLNALYRCSHPNHISLPCYSDGRLLRLSYPHSVSAITASGTGHAKVLISWLRVLSIFFYYRWAVRMAKSSAWSYFWRWNQGGHGCRY